MGQGRHIQSLVRGFLLIAVAIQGITPDAQDLASPRAIQLLFPNLDEDRAIRDEDDLPDDVCESAPLKSNWVSRRIGGARPHSDHAATAGRGDPLRCETRERTCHGGIGVPFLRLNDSLCRRNC